MHEASVVEGLLAVALDELGKYDAAHPGSQLRVTRLECELGLFACVEEETLKGCFELFAEGTRAAGAELVLSRKPLPCVCSDCGRSFMLERKQFVCPQCGGDNLRFSGGNGITLTGLRVENGAI